MSIDDTTKMDPSLLLGLAMAFGPSESIEMLERMGQGQVVNGDSLPSDMEPDREAFEALGFVFGEPVDDLFVRVSLPEGWTKVATDHDMWSKVVDETGTERVSVFYKAAPYDRRAHMRLLETPHAD